jgi:hypothetical protein
MHLYKNLKIVILVIVVLLILVIIRNSDQNIFKREVKTAIEAVQTNSNLITPDQLQKRTNPYLVINLGSGDRQDSIQFQHSVQIPFENLLDKANRQVLNEAEGDLILFSVDVATASKAWVILNQLGYKNVMILTSEENPDELKHKFQPDTTVRLEQDSI